MIPSFVFKGPTHRVQVRVYDFRDDNQPTPGPPVKFAVHALPNDFDPSTPFTSKAGLFLCYTEHCNLMWHNVKAYCPEAEMPAKLRKYLM